MGEDSVPGVSGNAMGNAMLLTPLAEPWVHKGKRRPGGTNPPSDRDDTAGRRGRPAGRRSRRRTSLVIYTKLCSVSAQGVCRLRIWHVERARLADYMVATLSPSFYYISFRPNTMCPHPLLFGDVHDLKESLELFAGGDRARGREIFNTREFAVQAVWPVDSSLRVDVNESGTKELVWTDEMAHRQSLVDVLKELNRQTDSFNWDTNPALAVSRGVDPPSPPPHTRPHTHSHTQCTRLPHNTRQRAPVLSPPHIDATRPRAEVRSGCSDAQRYARVQWRPE